MLLCNLHLVGHEEDTRDVLIKGSTIVSIMPNKLNNEAPGEFNLKFDNAIAFPGLINSHDHLDFNLFHPTGNRIYNNYFEWGRDIHLHNKKSIDAVLQVPQADRVIWGLYKNLLNGITTVVNHGEKILVNNDLVDVIQDHYCLHSIQFEKTWKRRLNRPFIQNKPVVIHIGEGTDAAARSEVDTLIRWNLFKRKIIGVHGVAMNASQARAFVAVVWCPSSNFFLLNQTAPVNILKQVVPILFGTDSTLTSGWNLWEHLRMARNTRMMTDSELFATLTANPAAIWSLPKSGSLENGFNADVVVATKKGSGNNLEAFFALDPDDLLLVIHKGVVKMIDESIIAAMDPASMHAFTKVCTGKKNKYVAGDGGSNKYIPYYLSL
jgi:cytosine/adenosine deaminase-related metal-dependent hydrolase